MNVLSIPIQTYKDYLIKIITDKILIMPKNNFYGIEMTRMPVVLDCPSIKLNDKRNDEIYFLDYLFYTGEIKSLYLTLPFTSFIFSVDNQPPSQSSLSDNNEDYLLVYHNFKSFNLSLYRKFYLRYFINSLTIPNNTEIVYHFPFIKNYRLIFKNILFYNYTDNQSLEIKLLCGNKLKDLPINDFLIIDNIDLLTSLVLKTGDNPAKISLFFNCEI